MLKFKQKVIVIGLVLLSVLMIPTLCKLIYHSEVSLIRYKLNSIKNVDVIEMDFHDDILPEEIRGKVKISGKGSLYLDNLSRDVFNYPEKVDLSEVDQYKIMAFVCSDEFDGITHGLDLGTNGYLKDQIDIEFLKLEDVVKNFDTIKKLIDSFPYLPETFHYVSESENLEYFIGKYIGEYDNVVLMHQSLGINNTFFRDSLNWKSEKCQELFKFYYQKNDG